MSEATALSEPPPLPKPYLLTFTRVDWLHSVRMMFSESLPTFMKDEGSIERKIKLILSVKLEHDKLTHIPIMGR